MTTSRTRLIAALAFVLPAAALVVSPAMATTTSHSHHHSKSVKHAKTHKSKGSTKAAS